MEASTVTTGVTAGADPFLGRTLLFGNYCVDKKLGEGAMGVVYRMAHATLPDTFVALKVLNRPAMSNPQIVERFQQEARAAAAVGSHRVVKPIDTGNFEDGTPYIVMEYVPGRSLAEELTASGPMPVTTALKIAFRVADTMVLAHHRGIIHRDLKPPNILLVFEGGQDFAVRLLDFGVARATGEFKVAHTIDRAAMGTPGYMPPEAWAGSSVDGRADVFSLGVTLYRMLTGELPFPSATLEEAMTNVLTLAPAPVATRRPPQLDTVPASVERLILRALTKKAAERPTMEAFHAALAAELRATTPTAHHDELMSVIVPVTTDPRETPTLSASAQEVAALIDHLTPQSLRVATAPATAQKPLSTAPAPHSTNPRHADVKSGDRRALWTLVVALVVVLGVVCAAWISASRDAHRRVEAPVPVGTAAASTAPTASPSAVAPAPALSEKVAGATVERVLPPAAPISVNSAAPPVVEKAPRKVAQRPMDPAPAAASKNSSAREKDLNAPDPPRRDRVKAAASPPAPAGKDTASPGLLEME